MSSCIAPRSITNSYYLDSLIIGCWSVGCTCVESDDTTSILYPGGRNMLNPMMRSGWPLNRLDTRPVTPGVSMLDIKILKR